MKIMQMLAVAGLFGASVVASTTAAEAKDHGRNYSYEVDRGRGNHERNYERYDGRHDNGNHYGWRNGRGHQRCYTQWRHHRAVRVCR